MLLNFHIVAGGKHLVTESYTEFLTKKQTLYRKGVQKFGSNIDIEKIQLKLRCSRYYLARTIFYRS